MNFGDKNITPGFLVALGRSDGWWVMVDRHVGRRRREAVSFGIEGIHARILPPVLPRGSGLGGIVVYLTA